MRRPSPVRVPRPQPVHRGLQSLGVGAGVGQLVLQLLDLGGQRLHLVIGLVAFRGDRRDLGFDLRQEPVDLASGGLTVTSTEPVDEAAVRAAVEEAGYQVTG